MRSFLRSARLAMLAFAAAIAGFGSLTHATFLVPSTWTRGDPYSTYHQWQVFNSTAGPNAPDVGELPNATTFPHPPRANVVDTSGGGFITSGGNIYSFSVPIDIDVTVPDYSLGSAYVTTVMLQTKTLGTETDYASVRLTYNDGTDHTIPPSQPRTELYRLSLGGFGGSDVESKYEFQVPFSAPLLKLEFIAMESSMSLDALAVDTLTTRLDSNSPSVPGLSALTGFAPTPVPEPATMGILLLGGLLLRRSRAM